MTTYLFIPRSFIRTMLIIGAIFFTPATMAAFDGSSPIEIQSSATDNLRDVTSAADGGAGTWVAWVQDNVNTSNDELMISRIDVVGNFLVQPLLVKTSPQTLTDLVLAVDSVDSDSVFLAWTDSNNDGVVGAERLWVTNFNGGAVQWILPQGMGSAMQRPDMMVADGDAIVAWTDFRSSFPDIYALRLAASDGASVWGEVAVTTVPGNQDNVSIAISKGDNDAFIGFTDESPGVGDVRIRVVKVQVASGNVLLSSTILNNEVAGEAALDPTLFSDTEGGFFASWHQGVSSQPVTIYTSRWSSELMPDGGVISVADASKNSNDVMLNVSSGSGGVFLAWRDGRNGADDIYASRISHLLEEVWVSGGVKVATTGISSKLDRPSISSDDKGGAFVSYSRFNNTETLLETSYIPAITSVEPLDGFLFASPGVDVTIANEGSNLTLTQDGVIATWLGLSLTDNNAHKIFSQIFSGEIQASRIVTPVAVSPPNATQIPFGTAITFEASVFNQAGLTAHAAAEFRIIDQGGNEVLGSGTAIGGTSIEFNEQDLSTLVTGDTYSWQVRYASSTGELSAWSAPTTFVIFSTPPTITPLQNQLIDLASGETEVTQSFALTDVDGDINDVGVTATSNMPNIIANTGISISGSGATRSISVMPLPNGDGVVFITVVATDSTGLTATTQYTVTVSGTSSATTPTSSSGGGSFGLLLLFMFSLGLIALRRNIGLSTGR